jgi:hypothetical protein
LESIQEIWPPSRHVCGGVEISWKCAFRNDLSNIHVERKDYAKETPTEHLSRITKDVYEPFVEAWKTLEEK